MAVYLTAGESIDAAYRRLIREMISNGVFLELENQRFHIPKGEKIRDKRRAWYKTKRKRASARRKNKNKTI